MVVMEEIAAKRKGLRSRWPRRSARQLRSRAQERSIASDVHPRRSCYKKAEHQRGDGEASLQSGVAGLQEMEASSQAAKCGAY